jgi:beta-glucosidase
MATEPSRTFPADFVWGAATAAYQIEGAVDADGRGESIWDRFSATPGKVRNAETGAIACDFYNRYPEDVQLIRSLGLDAFRFSIAWPRVLPEGRGRVNAAGLDYYDRLVDELLANGIEPYATLYHWDLPQVLEERGGWPARETAEAFVEYTEAVAGRLGDRVTRWITHNEPWVVAWLGYSWGVHAPGRTSDADAIATSHHLLLSHGWAVDVLRREVPNAQVGITLNLAHVDAAGDTPEDLDAARIVDGNLNRWYLDPLFRGAYPEDMLEHYAPDAPDVRDGDLEAISAPIDFLGVNNYSRHLVRASANGEGPHMVRDPESQYTDMGWEIYPQGLYQLLARVRDDYGPAAIYITENGAAFGDIRSHDGQVHDPERRDYIAQHVDAVGRALEEGVPMKGYFVWSLLDNYEWAFGYGKRFGIVYVDYPTLERVPKDSAHWYRDFVAAQRQAAATV